MPTSRASSSSDSNAALLKLRPFLALVLLTLSGLSVPSAVACNDGTVRDAAFTRPRDIHRLCVIARSDDPSGAAITRQLAAWLAKSGTGLNIELIDVAAEAAEVAWDDYGIPSAPPVLPVVVLAGRRSAKRTSFFIDYWQPAPTAEDLERLRDSPAREAIRRQIGRNLAVLVYVSGTGPHAGQAKALIERLSAARSQPGQLGVATVQVDRSDPRERILLSFIGVKPDGPDWVGVVFGPGKFMTPLAGDAITEAQLTGLLDGLAGECTCMQSPSRLGTDIPMLWQAADQQTLVRLAPPGDATDTAAEMPLSVTALPARTVDPNSPTAAAALSTMATTFRALGGLLLLVVLAAAAVTWRQLRREGQ